MDAGTGRMPGTPASIELNRRAERDHITAIDGHHLPSDHGGEEAITIQDDTKTNEETWVFGEVFEDLDPTSDFPHYKETS